MIVFRTLLFGLVLSAAGITGQTDLTPYDDLYGTKRYSGALPLLLDELKKTPDNAALNYKAGVCYMNSRSQKTKALPFLSKAVKNSVSFYTHGFAKETDAPIEAYKLLGDAYEMVHKFDSAIVAYDSYLEALKGAKNTDASIVSETERKLLLCHYGKQLSESDDVSFVFNFDKSPEPISAKKGQIAASDYSSALSADKTAMIYTLRVPLQKMKKLEDLKYFEDAGIVSRVDSLPKVASTGPVKKGKPQNQDTIINLTTIGTSVDGQVVLTYKDERSDGNLFVSRLKGNTWSAPQKLPKTVNESGWETSEFVTADGATMYFISDREGGYGGKDIYRCKKLANGRWSKARNLGPDINTAFDEEAPFLHTDNVTLYFSSNRYKPTTCFDIFSAVMTDTLKWAKPQLVGYPVNSSDDNVFYQVASDKKKIFKASKGSPVAEVQPDKEDKKSKKDSLKNAVPEKDNYVISFMNQNRGELTLLKGEVVDAEEKALTGVKIIVTDNTTGKVQGIYHSDLKSGHFSFVLPSGKNNNITFEAPGYLFYSENSTIKPGTDYFEKQNSVTLLPVAEKSKVELNNVFFERDANVLAPASNVEIDRVFAFLKENPQVKVIINNYIYTPENAKFNKRLSEDRAEAVVKHLIEKGIDKKQITAKGHRKSKPPTKDKKEKEPAKPKTMLKVEVPAIQQLEMEIKEIEK